MRRQLHAMQLLCSYAGVGPSLLVRQRSRASTFTAHLRTAPLRAPPARVGNTCADSANPRTHVSPREWEEGQKKVDGGPARCPTSIQSTHADEKTSPQNRHVAHARAALRSLCIGSNASTSHDNPCVPIAKGPTSCRVSGKKGRKKSMVEAKARESSRLSHGARPWPCPPRCHVASTTSRRRASAASGLICTAKGKGPTRGSGVEGAPILLAHNNVAALLSYPCSPPACLLPALMTERPQAPSYRLPTALPATATPPPACSPPACLPQPPSASPPAPGSPGWTPAARWPWRLWEKKTVASMKRNPSWWVISKVRYCAFR